MSNPFQLNRGYEKTLSILAIIAVIASAFHFWPFASSSLWKVANVSNLSIIMGGVLVVLKIVLDKNEKLDIHQILPPLSILAYLLFHLLSCTYADTLSRPAVYTVKISLVMVGGYMLLTRAFKNSKTNAIYWAIILAGFISVFSTLYYQYILKSTDLGFFQNSYKYGTYTSIVGSFAIVYLFSGRVFWQYLSGFLLLLGLALTFRNIGGLIGVLSGLAVGLVICWRTSARNVLCLGILMLIVASLSFSSAILHDFKIMEDDGVNLRQRYIEWQAEMNMLETYGITGSGAGSINDYRSNYYYRLPKLNTLQSFDQNGWVTVSAETGFMGLICFIWIIYEHGRFLFRSKSDSLLQRQRVALISALAASCVCNVFSSVYYNGVLIAFVVILALSKIVYHSTEKEHE